MQNQHTPRGEFIQSSVLAMADVAAATALPSSSAADHYASLRQAPQTLSDSGGKFVHWAAEHVSLAYTALRFPHVINRLATVWPNYRSMAVEVDKLMVIDRPHREGFPAAVIRELSAFQQFCVARRDVF